MESLLPVLKRLCNFFYEKCCSLFSRPLFPEPKLCLMKKILLVKERKQSFMHNISNTLDKIDSKLMDFNVDIIPYYTNNKILEIKFEAQAKQSYL